MKPPKSAPAEPAAKHSKLPLAEHAEPHKPDPLPKPEIPKEAAHRWKEQSQQIHPEVPNLKP
jgi:hypothetical protein